MKLHVKPLAVAVVVMTALSGFQVPQAAAADAKKAETPIEMGMKVATNKKKGNCMACHQFAGAKLPGNIGPPLVAMKARFPDKQKLRDLIWDKYKILKDEDIDNIAEWVYTL
jgi:sulfur-oxidizing protein SoxX